MVLIVAELIDTLEKVLPKGVVILGIIVILIVPKWRKAFIEMIKEGHAAGKKAAEKVDEERRRKKEEQSSAQSPAEIMPEVLYYLHLNDQVEGPFPLEEIKGRLAAGTIAPETPCCQAGAEEWQPVEAVVR